MPARQTDSVRLQTRNNLTAVGVAGYGQSTDFKRAPDAHEASGGFKTDFAESVFLCPVFYSRALAALPLVDGSHRVRAVYTGTKRGQLLDSYTTIKSLNYRARYYFGHVVLTLCGVMA